MIIQIVLIAFTVKDNISNCEFRFEFESAPTNQCKFKIMDPFL